MSDDGESFKAYVAAKYQMAWKRSLAAHPEITNEGQMLVGQILAILASWDAPKTEQIAICEVLMEQLGVTLELYAADRITEAN